MSLASPATEDLLLEILEILDFLDLLDLFS